MLPVTLLKIKPHHVDMSHSYLHFRTWNYSIQLKLQGFQNALYTLFFLLHQAVVFRKAYIIF